MQYPLRQGNTNGTPALRVGSAPGVDSTLQTPQTVTQIPGHGIHSNAIINRHYLMNSNGIADQLINTGQLVFILKQRAPVRAAAKTHTLVNLPMLNYHLFKSAFDETGKYESVSDVLHEWSCQGVVVNAFGAEQDQSSSRVRNQSKVINLTVGGGSQTMNLWGSIADGDHLYLTVKKMELPSGTMFRFNRDSSRVVQDRMTCYQILPTTTPSFEADTVSINIGRVYRSKRMTTVKPPPTQITRDVPLMIRTGDQFEFLVDIKRPRVHI